MTNGWYGDWADELKYYEDQMLERICLLLPVCIATLGENPKEDDITLNLVKRLERDPQAWKIFYNCEFQFESTEIDARGAYRSKGKIDMAVFMGEDRERYLAYEAKRLNVKTGRGIASLAVPYVKEGVARFVSGQYAEGLPVACMLGYVLNGDMDTLVSKLNQALKEHRVAVALRSGPTPLPPAHGARRFETDHDRPSGSPITLRHALAPCF